MSAVRALAAVLLAGGGLFAVGGGPAGMVEAPVSKPIPTPAEVAPPVAAAAPPEPADPPLADDELGLVPDPALRGAVAHLAAGRAAEALKLLPASVAAPELRYVRARALAASGAHAEAGKLFAAVAADLPPLAARSHCEAAQAFEEAGNLAAAARHLPPCAADPVLGRDAALQRARLELRRSRPDDALESLAPLLGEAGPLRAEALFLAGQAREAAGRDAWALEGYRTLFVEEPTSPWAGRARTRAGELVRKLKAAPIAEARLADRVERLLQSGRSVRAAVAELKQLTAPPICVGAACTPARCRAPEPADAAAVAVVASASPAVTAFTLAELHEEEAPPETPPPLPACARDEPATPAEPFRCRVQLLRGWAARQSRAHAKAVELLRPVYEQCAGAGLRAQALLLAALSARTARLPEAPELALLVALQFPDQPGAADAWFQLASQAREAGDLRGEQRALRALVQRHPASPVRGDALFQLFWSHRAAGRPERGLWALDVLSREYDSGPRGDGGDAERGRYWWGRTVATAAAETDRPLGAKALAKLAEERPLTYYGLLARSMLATLDTAPAPAPPVVADHPGGLRPGLLRKDPAFVAALELWRLGLADDAKKALLAVDLAALRADGARGHESLTLIAELLGRQGDPRGAHHVARRELLSIIRRVADPIAMRASLLAYPLMFREPIAKSTAADGFAANLLQGLMREESALNPGARSPVGARGLTQVMPATAREVARRLKLPKFHPNQLWDPATNIRIGSWYLGSMLRKFGHPGLAAAAYNAGPGAVKRWLDAKPPGLFDEFVEEIPYGETRNYVKRVLRSYATYQYLYEPAAERGLTVSLQIAAHAAPPR